MNKLTCCTAIYGNKTILVQPYIEEREQFIMEIISKLAQIKSFLQSDDIICHPLRDNERKYLIDKLEELYKTGLELIK
jgi:hypothetical protein